MPEKLGDPVVAIGKLARSKAEGDSLSEVKVDFVR